MIIAIDGPAGSGKSTIAKLIAAENNLTYLDTGAMYRMFTLKMLRNKIDCQDFENIKKLLENLDINIDENNFYLDNEKVNDEIRSYEISTYVSKVAAIKEVREKMVELQREFSKSKNVILDGRDIGTVVFPNADFKIYLVANVEERARRRYKELLDKGQTESFEEILKNIKERDFIDSTREVTPLKKAEDAIEIDTSGKTIKQVKEEIINFMSSK